MVNILPFLNNQFEQVTLITCVLIIILVIATLGSDEVSSAKGYSFLIISIILAVTPVAMVVLKKNPNLIPKQLTSLN